jgi:hypothetical protein
VILERRYGICRTVFLAGAWAVKVPRLRGYRGRAAVWSIVRGVSANLSELDWSGTEGVVPVRWSLLGLVSVYPRCVPWPEDGPEPAYDAIGVGWLPRDRKRANVGLLDGRPVWLDYDGSWNGCPHSRNVAGLEVGVS